MTLEKFLEKVQQNTQAEVKEQNLYCRPCRKSFAKDKSYNEHMLSKKHLDVVERNGGKDDTKEYLEQLEKEGRSGKKDKIDFANDDDFEDVSTICNQSFPLSIANPPHLQVDTDEEMELDMDTNQCIFCKELSPDMVANLKHMSVAHSFFVPDTEYCTSLEHLIEYLLIKVTKDFICLWCNDKGKTFYDVDSVRKHMADKGHCKMLYEGESLAEFVDFFDYSSSYPDHGEGMDLDADLSDNEGGNAGNDTAEGDEFQLVLPSGAVVGHRSLLRYYKQKLNPERQLVPKKSNKHLHKVLHEYRALGWTAIQQEAAARKARDIHVMKRRYNKLSMQVGVKANKLQTHFREQILQ